MTEIKTERLRLRPPRLEDGEAMVVYLNDYEAARMMARIPHPYTLEDWEGFFDHIQNGPEEFFVLTDKENGQLLGAISFAHEGAEPILGYWLGAPHRGKGLMREAGMAMLRHGFAAGVPSIKSGHFKDNAASGKVLTALGFIAFEVGDETSLARGDELIPHVTMRLTRERFEELYPAG